MNKYRRRRIRRSHRLLPPGASTRSADAPEFQTSVCRSAHLRRRPRVQAAGPIRARGRGRRRCSSRVRAAAPLQRGRARSHLPLTFAEPPIVETEDEDGDEEMPPVSEAAISQARRALEAAGLPVNQSLSDGRTDPASLLCALGGARVVVDTCVFHPARRAPFAAAVTGEASRLYVLRSILNHEQPGRPRCRRCRRRGRRPPTLPTPSVGTSTRTGRVSDIGPPHTRCPATHAPLLPLQVRGHRRPFAGMAVLAAGTARGARHRRAAAADAAAAAAARRLVEHPFEEEPSERPRARARGRRRRP